MEYSMEINFSSAINYFPEMIEEIQKGKDYVIIKGGHPIARISPINENALSRQEIADRLFRYQSLAKL
jgi:antitoxin (DNA-binding transcriptional repressor) of toxin-antitoxin stability system